MTSVEAGTLYLVATPIGHLQDITLRALTVLREVDAVLCEDTRRTRVLLQAHGIRKRLVSFHAHNEARRIPQALRRLQSGAA
ncbi:MAG: SAM-dependent methyltransferase, partial [Acidobacteria bacterium]|nr:SAM-dependent methyltransferase [Acidobacteriota bacterium]MDW7985057.1 SAM-dependent methyltransferase [Acidobacteriota bacterium]